MLRLNNKPNSQRLAYFGNGIEARTCVCAQSFVERFTTNTGSLGDLCHTACTRGHAQSIGQFSNIAIFDHLRQICCNIRLVT